MKILFVTSHPERIRHIRSLITLLRLKPLPDNYNAEILTLDELTAGMPYYDTLRPYVVSHTWRYRVWVQKRQVRRFLHFLLGERFASFKEWVCRQEAKALQRKHQYDAVVGYAEVDAMYFTSLFDTRRIAWIPHNIDNYRSESALYAKFERIVCCSGFTRSSFVSLFPECADKTEVIYNPIDTGHIARMAYSPIWDDNFKTDVFTIISVGEMTEAQRYHLIPSVVSKMTALAPSLQFRWYIIACCSEQYIRKVNDEIRQHKVSDFVKLLGRRDNPYSYVSQSALFVDMSDSVAFPNAVVEALSLHVPAVSLCKEPTRELMPKEMGYVSDLEELPLRLTRLVMDEDGAYSRMKQKAKDYVYDNNRVIRDVRKLLSGGTFIKDIQCVPNADAGLVSIVVPVYNVAGYLPRCMETLLAQTYTDIEIIMVDDGSTDGSGEMCDAFAAQDHRCRVIHQTNSGLWAARNAGKRAATGRYLSFVDSDDYVHREMIASLVAAINADSGYDIAVMDRSETMTLNEDVTQTADNVQYSELSQQDLIEGMLGTEDRVFYVYAWNKLYRTDLIRDIYSGPYWTSQDFDFNSQVYKRVQRAVWVHRPLYYYVQRQGSQVHNPRSMEMYLKSRTEILYHILMELTPDMSCYRHSLLRNLYDFMERLIHNRWHTSERDEWCAKCRRYERDARWIYWRDSAFPLRKKLFSTLTIVLTRWPHVLRWLYNVKRRNNNPFA